MLRSKRNRELAETDFDWLESMLSRVVGGLVPNVEALDGFMTALVVCPDLIKPSEYVQIIVSGKTEDGDLVFESAREVERFYDVLMRYWNEINGAFRRSELRMPYLADNAEESPAATIGRKGSWRGPVSGMTSGARSSMTRPHRSSRSGRWPTSMNRTRPCAHTTIPCRRSGARS